MKKRITPDNIPLPAKDLCTECSSSGSVTILMHNNGIFDRIVQKLFGRPKISRIHLDETGSFVWSCIDGSSITEIGSKVKERFGSEAEPLYPRLILFFTLLRDCGFVEITK
ncbi:MAG: PqqD family protein [Huintestinicola sp.]|uniref:PqqD family protein n=1 Tax=Huintestinicola sp. TaxID=2981661 RepID=UPI003F0F1471